MSSNDTVRVVIPMEGGERFERTYALTTTIKELMDDFQKEKDAVLRPNYEDETSHTEKPLEPTMTVAELASIKGLKFTYVPRKKKKNIQQNVPKNVNLPQQNLPSNYMDPSIQAAIGAGTSAVNNVKAQPQPQPMGTTEMKGPGGIKYGVVSEKTLGRWAVGQPLPKDFTRQIGGPVVLDPNQNFITQKGRPLTQEELKALTEQAPQYGQPIDIPCQGGIDPVLQNAVPLNSLPAFQNFGTDLTQKTNANFQNNYINTYGAQSTAPLGQTSFPQTQPITSLGNVPTMSQNEVNQFLPGAIINGQNGINIPGLPQGIPVVMNGCTVQDLMQMPMEMQPMQQLPPTIMSGTNNHGYAPL